LSITEILLSITGIIAFGGVLSYAVYLKYKNIRMAGKLVQAVVDKNTIANQLNQVTSNKKIKDIEEKDGFIKFLSDSRDSAFEYIEEVQKTVYLFKDDLEPIVEAYRDSGTASESMQKVVRAYDNVISLLPADE
jgi:hypothetical protein